MSKKGKGHSRKEEVSSVTQKGTVYLPNDCVLINPDANAPAYVGFCAGHAAQAGRLGHV